MLTGDYFEPHYIKNYLKSSAIDFTYWGEFTRIAKFNRDERVVCVVSGKERFRVVSSIFKQNMYSGIYEDLNPLDTPINLFERDMRKV